MNEATKNLHLTESHIDDLRPLDFQSGKRLAIGRDAMEECECCGKRIAKIHVMMQGYRVGSECAGYLAIPVYRMGRTNKHAEALLAKHFGVAA